MLKMDQVKQEAMADDTLIGPEKRKRGRPRKDPSERRHERAHSRATANVPPGFKQLPRVDPINDPTEVMVGQTVTGVVQATFDAGYLLAVRIGNSNITLTGAVFKSGHTAPVTPENDVAPLAEMIKRTEIPFPTGLQPKRRRKRRSKENNMQLVTCVGNGSDPVVTNSGPKTDYVLPPSVPQVGARGTVVPVVLKPINLSNGLSINKPAPHLRASQGKPMHSILPLAVYPPNRPTSPAPDSLSSSQFMVTPSQSGNENAFLKHAEGGKAVKSSEVQYRVVKREPGIGDMNEPIFVEPLQTRHMVQNFQPHVLFGGAIHGGAGRMTELLQKMGDDQVSRNEHPTASYNGSGQAGRM